MAFYDAAKKMMGAIGTKKKAKAQAKPKMTTGGGLLKPGKSTKPKGGGLGGLMGSKVSGGATRATPAKPQPRARAGGIGGALAGGAKKSSGGAAGAASTMGKLMGAGSGKAVPYKARSLMGDTIGRMTPKGGRAANPMQKGAVLAGGKPAGMPTKVSTSPIGAAVPLLRKKR